MLKGAVKEFIGEATRTVAEAKEFRILELKVMPDHIHLFVSAPPQFFPNGDSQNVQGDHRFENVEVPRAEEGALGRAPVVSELLHRNSGARFSGGDSEVHRGEPQFIHRLKKRWSYKKGGNFDPSPTRPAGK
jgi:hypothetical protein